MRIRVKAEGRNIRLALPNWFVFNRVTRAIAVRCVRECAHVPITGEQLDALFAELRRTRQLLGGRPLVSVQTSEGEKVYIRL